MTRANPVCQRCDTGEVDNLQHALATCPRSASVFNWMMQGLQKFDSGLTSEKVLILDFCPDTPLPFGELPLIWFISTVLGNLWDSRASGKAGNLNYITASVIADCNIIRETKYRDMALIIDMMIDS